MIIVLSVECHTFRFIGQLSVMDNCPTWHFDEGFRKENISSPNLKRDRKNMKMPE